MPINTNAILGEIDTVLARYEEVETKHRKEFRDMGGEVVNFVDAPGYVAGEIIALLQETINRLAPVRNYGARALENVGTGKSEWIRALAGVLKALRSDYAAGRLLNAQERIRSDLFSDFLEMAEYLLDDEGLKDPAVVLAGGVLEQHLRKLCDKHSITLPPKATINPVNAALATAKVYGKNEEKQITAWAGLRNSAAHGHYDDYSVEQVRLMVQGIRHFLGSYPA